MTPNGAFRLPSDAKRARNRPSGLGFGTQRGDGFATGSAQLQREIFRDYPDLNLLDTWRFIGKNGEIAYEGRLHSNPRSNDPAPTIDCQLTGLMTMLKGRKIAPLIIDRRLDQWGGPTTQRKRNVLNAGYRYAGEMSTTGQADGIYAPAIVFSFNDFNKLKTEIGQAFFYAGGEDIGYVRARVERLEGGAENTDWTAAVFLSTDDLGTTTDTSADLQNGNYNGEAVAGGTGRKYAELRDVYEGTVEETGVNIAHAFLNPRVIGTHGLTERGSQPEEGYYLSDIIAYIVGTYYPKIDTSGIQPNTFPLTQASWHDNPAPGYDIISQLNELVLFEMNMWEGPTFHYHLADLNSYDWVIRTDEPGVQTVFQGDSVENFANGVAVTYTDILTGRKNVLYPDDHPEELRDESETNPYNKLGEAGWIDVELPWQGTEAEALRFGNAYLTEYNRPKRPGSFRVSGGYIKDYAENWHQGWKVRCSETLGIGDHPSDAPRLITATNWDEESATLEITVDAAPSTLEAVVARHELARTSRNP